MARVRMSDVAVAAGVSTATVSMVLSGAGSDRISPQTQARVREAAAAIGYAPNSVARSLRTQRTRMIGLVSDTIATTPFAGRMLAGANDVARDHGNLVVLVNTDDDAAQERQAIQALTGQRVDAMIYARMWHRVVDAPAGLPADTVFLDCRPAQGGWPAVVPDDRRGGVVATRELVAAGHRRIAYVDAPRDDEVVASRLRHEGYLEVLAEAGITPDPALHVRGITDAGGGRAATEELFALPAERRPTAIFCFNDRMAMGAYTAAYRRGLRIPDDLSIVGYDDQQLIAAEIDPPLTTVALPHYEMGRWAMEVALGVRESDRDAPLLMDCPMIRRDSVGPPPTPAGN
ncbi:MULTISPECIES: LacI family DNA-binding transcriptional regulator [Streptomyces]|uniref:LacI family transcriptional regulator n=1 Tax=Streptomyces nymphaeiformis TaxID=2663842 RepID=A0A7W7U508_9ACTN|nr:LacI family DNA-binding transcriptional regulator [Streptomyces nymphaeiformis]MBB4985208.1 LacI family transcriptional regulator [Streptomyces nymphaeiformis]